MAYHATRAHPLVRTNYTVRSLAFAYAFVAIGIHLWERGGGALGWTLLAAQFLAYPHLVYLRASRSADPWRAELVNLNLDAALLGAWSAGLGWPVWIAYTLFFATSLNGAVNRSLHGIGMAWGSFGLGVLAWSAVAWTEPGGVRIDPATSTLVAALCVAGSIGYSLAVGLVVHRQTLRLREARTALARDLAELRRRDEQLSIAGRALESMAEAVMITRPDGRVVWVNKAFEATTGYPAGDVRDRPEREFRSGMQPEAFYYDAYEAVDRDGHWTGISWSRRRDGTLYRESRNISAVRDEAGAILFYVSVFSEIDPEGAELRAAPRRSTAA
jgi:PAS domain S-box-containing protein